MRSLVYLLDYVGLALFAAGAVALFFRYLGGPGDDGDGHKAKAR